MHDKNSDNHKHIPSINVCVDAQADISARWLHVLFCWNDAHWINNLVYRGKMTKNYLYRICYQ